MQDKKERNAAKDFVSGLLLVLFGIFIVVDALNMKIYNTFLDAPGFFPAIVGGVIILLGAILAFIGFRLEASIFENTAHIDIHPVNLSII